MKKARFYAGLITLLDFLGWYKFIKWWRRRQSNCLKILFYSNDLVDQHFSFYHQKYHHFFSLATFSDFDGSWNLIHPAAGGVNPGKSVHLLFQRCLWKSKSDQGGKS